MDGGGVLPIGKTLRIIAVRHAAKLVFKPRRHAAVERAAIGVDDRRQIILALHSALDLERIYARGRKLREAGNQIEILAVEKIGAPLVLLDGKPSRLAVCGRERAHFVLPAARLHARAAIGGAPSR